MKRKKTSITKIKVLLYLLFLHVSLNIYAPKLKVTLIPIEGIATLAVQRNHKQILTWIRVYLHRNFAFLQFAGLEKIDVRLLVPLLENLLDDGVQVIETSTIDKISPLALELVILSDVNLHWMLIARHYSPMITYMHEDFKIKY